MDTNGCECGPQRHGQMGTQFAYCGFASWVTLRVAADKSTETSRRFYSESFRVTTNVVRDHGGVLTEFF
jgi:hypothetical protein